MSIRTILLCILIFNVYSLSAHVYTIMNSTPVTIRVIFTNPYKKNKNVFDTILAPNQDAKYDSGGDCVFSVIVEQSGVELRDISYARLVDFTGARCYSKDWSVISAMQPDRSFKLKKVTFKKGKGKKEEKWLKQFDLVERY